MTPKLSTVKETLSGSSVHQIWERTYRNTKSERFYEGVFDWIAAIQPLQTLRALDIGCGIGNHAIRLAKRGCNVVAADFSPDRVAAATENIERQGFGSRISICNEDLALGLSFPDASFDIVLCWGVLMHIPQIESAIGELVRVTRPGGRILVWDANLFGVDAMLTAVSTAVKKIVGAARSRHVQFSKFGNEYWNDTPSGRLLTRHSNIRALSRSFEAQGCQLLHRISGEFTEIYGVGGPLAQFAHIWNRAWFAAGHIPYLAHANLLVLERNRSDSTLVQRMRRTC